MGRKGYSADEISLALVKLAVNGGDLDKTAAETGISRMTLYRWKKNQAPSEMADSIGEKVELVIKHLLDHPPEKMSGRDWAIALGILMDKYLIMQGSATSRTENININENNEQTQDDREFFDELSKANSAIDRLSDGKKEAAGSL